MLYTNIVCLALILGIFILALKVKKYKNMWDRENAFLAGLSHDLKNPANAQISIFNMLLDGEFGKLTPQQCEIIELTRNSSKYMTNLVGTILTNYKFAKGNIQLHKKYFNLEKLILSVCSENIYQAKNKNLDIVYTPKCEEYIVFGDMLQIKRVIENLLSNAITYGISGSKIEICLNKNASVISFTVKNESIPIPDENLNDLFKPFWQANSSKLNNTGSGLGLYVSKNIIKMHGGKIFVTKESYNKINFGFEIPEAHATHYALKIRDKIQEKIKDYI